MDNGNFKVKHYHQNYGYDLEATLSKHSIKGLEKDDYKNNLMDSLKKGNIQFVTFKQDASEQKQFIEANPQFKTINILRWKMQKIVSKQSTEKQQSEAENKSVKQDGKKEKASIAADDGPELPKTTAKKRRKRALA